jgi:hypothetical protein
MVSRARSISGSIIDDCARNNDWKTINRTERNATTGLNNFFATKKRVTNSMTEISSANACFTKRDVPKIFIQVANRKKKNNGWPFDRSDGMASGVIPSP